MADIATETNQKPLLNAEIAHKDRDPSRLWAGELDYPDDQILASKGWDWEIYQALLRDDQVFSTLQQRRLAVVSREWEVTAGGSKRLDQKAADFIRDVVTHVSWDSITDKMLYGRFWGFAVAECLWARDGDTIYPERIKVKKQRRFRFDTDGRLRLLTHDAWDGERIEEQYPRKFWYFQCGGDNDDDAYGLGLASTLYWCVFFKRNGARFWAAYLENFGMPTPMGKYPPGASQDEKRRLLDALSAMRSGASVALPEGMMVELLQAVGSGAASYEQFQGYWDRAIAKITLGQVMTSEAVGGQYKADVQMDVRQELVKADSDLVNASANQAWVRWLIDWNYPGAAYPTLWRRLEDEPDLKPQAERDKILFDMGYTPNPAYVVETYGEGFEQPEPPEESAPLTGEQVGTLMQILDKGGAYGPEKLASVLQLAFPTLTEEQLAELTATPPAPDPAAAPGAGMEPGLDQPPAELPEVDLDSLDGLFSAGDLTFAKKCKKGISCGNACISALKTCRKALNPEQAEGGAAVATTAGAGAASGDSDVPQINSDGSHEGNTMSIEEYAQQIGISEEEARARYRAVAGWTVADYGDIRENQIDGVDDPRVEVIDAYLNSVPSFEGDVYRGLKFFDEDDYNSYLDSISGGVMDLNAHSSFTSSEEIGRSFVEGRSPFGALIRATGNRSGKSIAGVSEFPEEGEVLVPRGARYAVRNITREGNVSIIDVEEI